MPVAAVPPASGARPRPLVAKHEVRSLLEGLRASSGRTRATESPLDGAPLVEVPQSTPDDLDRAFADAREAQAAWAATPASARAEGFLQLHDLVLAEQESLCDLIITETGKARRDAHDEVLHVALTARYLGRTAARHLRRETRLGVLPFLTRGEVNHLPKGVVGVISPWNYPFTMAWCDGLAAVAAGNAVVAKPDARSMLTALAGHRLFRRAGFPAGLWQIVAGPGDEIGMGVVDRADHLCFTGSTATGRRVAARAGERLIGASLELGGKNPLVVLADADLAAAVDGAVRGCFANAGQLCVSFERLYVARERYAAFCAALVARVRALDLSVGLGWGPEVGTLASAEQLARVSAHVEDARARGATVLVGGRERPDLAPWAYEPTVLTGVTPAMACFAEETFGPVVAVHPFDTDADAVALANAGPEGLNASVWSRDEARALAVARRIRCGTVNVNEAIAATFGSIDLPMGGMGDSGLGRRQGREGVLRFTETQGVAVQRVGSLGGLPGLSQERYASTLRGALGVLRRTPRP